MAKGVQIIADEIHFDGELVAIITENPSASRRAAFEAALTEETELDTENLTKIAREYARGGLLRLSDLFNIIARLKEDTPA